MMFNFTLTPLELVEPWGGANDKATLNWFGLTDGEYWLSVGGQTLLEYGSDFRRKSGCSRYCNYPIVRIWEDLLNILPNVMNPVPSDLAEFIIERPASYPRSWPNVPENVRDAFHTAQLPIGCRHLDTGYLRPSADIRLWSDETSVNIDWDNRDAVVDGVQTWTSLSGKFKLPRADFEAEVRSFHKRLIDQMGIRVQHVVEGALPASIEIDLDGLVQDHNEWSKALDNALKEPPDATSWTEVRMARQIITSWNAVGER
jgi:Family of unknown function (DUF5984)